MQTEALRPIAGELARRYGCPVYLVGSALTGESPRDVDLRAVMPDAEFAARFGPVAEWREQGETGEWGDTRWKWSKECTRQTKRLWKQTGLNIDFQIQPASDAERYAHLARMMLS